jgi:DNA-binding transcriptional LysR family regulator
MRLDRFDLNLLVVLDALLEERNVTRASERVHIGQSAASAALGRLREYFGDDLLVPVGRRFELTPLGRSLVGPVRDVLLRARAAIALSPRFDPAAASRQFSVCASDYVVAVVLAQALRDLATSAPGIRVDISRPPVDMLDAFERGSFDVLIMPEQYVSRLEHPQERLFEDDHVCMVCSSHPLARQGLTMDDYLDHGHVALRLGDEASVAFEELFLVRYGRRRRNECTVDHFSSLPLLVMGTRRIATLHRRLAEAMAQRFPVTLLPTPIQIDPLVEVMVWPRYLDTDPAHQWLRAALLRAAQGLPAPAAPGSDPDRVDE